MKFIGLSSFTHESSNVKRDFHGFTNFPFYTLDGSSLIPHYLGLLSRAARDALYAAWKLDPGSLRWTYTWRVWSYITAPTWLMKKFPSWWVGVMSCLWADRDTYTNACLDIHTRFTHSSTNFLTSKTLPNWSESSQRFISWSNSFIREVIVILIFHGGGAIAYIGCCLWNREWIWDNRNSVQLCQIFIWHTLGLKNP